MVYMYTSLVAASTQLVPKSTRLQLNSLELVRVSVGVWVRMKTRARLRFRARIKLALGTT